MSKQLALDEITWNGCAVDGDKRSGCTWAHLVDRPRNQFLSRSALSADQAGCIGTSDSIDHREHVRHLGVLTDDATITAIPRKQQSLETCILSRQSGFVRRRGDGDDGLLEIERLGQEPESSRFPGVKSHIVRGVGGHQHHFAEGVVTTRLL